MSSTYFEEQVYEGIDFTATSLPKGEYEICSFVNCNFSNTDLSQIKFTECEFRGCNLSMVKMIKTSLN
jgi:fluoroquinolone resistance protein